MSMQDEPEFAAEEENPMLGEPAEDVDRTADGSSQDSVGRLLAAIALAVAVASIIVLTVVMPAEYGMDPTGVGGLLGLTALSGEAPVKGHSAVSPQAPQAAASSGGLSRALTPLRSNEGSVTLQPGQSVEVKADMLAGEGFTYVWRADGGPVDFDMHGEAASYWQDENQTGDQGVFVAPTNGLFGWYWVNNGQSPVTVTLWTSGFYKGLVRSQ